tara:strand:- start:898 stop:1917 length:1020 start_codon:yes stop_codon:yes gene_type:complete
MKYLENLNHEILVIFCTIIILSIYLKKISALLGLYDIPKSLRKIHKKPISIINGFFILLTVNLYFLVDIFILKENYLKFNVIVLILINIFYILGYLDDKKDLSPKTKSIIIVSTLLILIPFDQNLLLKSLIFKDLINREIFLHQSSFIVTIFFIFIFFNLLNFIDGVNGVAISVSIFFITVLAFERGTINNFEILFLSTLIYCLILNIMNKSFLGNSGVSVISILISVLYIKEYNLNQTLLCDEIFIIFLIPGIDMTRLVISRTIKRKSISDADLNHLHHYFMKIINKKFIFLIYIFISIFPYLISKILDNFALGILIGIIFYLFILLILMRSTKKIII